MKKKTYLIPLVLVVLGLLVPMVYAATRTNMGAQQNPSNVPVQSADEKDKVQDEVQDNQQNDQEEKDQDAGTVEEKKEQPASSGTTTSNKVSLSEQGSTSTKSKVEDTAARSQRVVKVAVGIIGKDGLINKSNVAVSESSNYGLTPIGALEATGVDFRAKGFSVGYMVISIAGQKNMGSSGWMFAVNGTAPNIGAGEYEIRDGDRILWYYSESIGSPVPNWNDL